MSPIATLVATFISKNRRQITIATHVTCSQCQMHGSLGHEG